MTRLRALLSDFKAATHVSVSALLRRPTAAASAPTPMPTGIARSTVDPAGSSAGWLRVLDHEQLLQNIRADKAMREIWRQSRLSAQAWQRDCVPALLRYAEFVQLVPASEAHHHAHAGGLLSHTIEMLLAAMTWRNGHLLPAGEPIEVIDAERDEWTYVVFFGALLHDIAKVMTDLRIQWRARDLAEPLRWLPLAGSLPQITRGRVEPEYLVEFTPKSARDYTAHSRLAMMLLPSIASATALGFMARQPRTFDALNQFLMGQDKDSLLAQIIRRADRASTERSLLSGSKARFSTATAVPLIDLLMEAIGSMLRAGVALPLNRSGAAGWVHDGAVWFVAKRLADSVRAWIKIHAPDESVPGDDKNDRLFDTWQEYGCIQVNPASGQAIWYVTVHGGGGEPEVEGDAVVGQGSSLEQDSYQHSLTMLRFPLARLYADPVRYPAEMRGRIEVHAKRKRDDTVQENEGNEAAAMAATTPISLPAAPAKSPELNGGTERQVVDHTGPAQTGAVKAPSDWLKPKMVIKAPGFNKPKRKPDPGGVMKPELAAAPDLDTAPTGIAAAALRENQHRVVKLPVAPAHAPADASPEAWLDADDDASAVTKQNTSARERSKATSMPMANTAQHSATLLVEATASIPPPGDANGCPPDAAFQISTRLPPTAETHLADSMLGAPAAAGTPPGASALPAPVVLMPKLPLLPQAAEASARPEPSALAIEFMKWLQASLASRRMTYNETGAAVHFTAEGMALVSPIIFKIFAREHGQEEDADERGLQVQREVIKAGWHMAGPKNTNIICYEVLGRGGASRGRLSAVVLVSPDRWVIPVPATNPALKFA